MRSIANMKTRLKSCRIGRSADNQGPRPLARNQAEVKKSATGTDFSQSLDSHQNWDQPNPDLPRTTANATKKEMTRIKWTREEYKEVLFAFYCALNKPSGRNVRETTFTNWKTHSKHPRDYLDCNKLANVRKDILKNNRYTDAEMEVIKKKAWVETQSSEKETDKSQTKTVNEVNDWQREKNTGFYGGGEVRENVREANNIERQEKEGANRTGVYDLTFAEQNRTVLSQVKNEIIREYAKIKNIEMKDRQSLVKVRNNKQALKQIEIANYTMKEVLEEFEPDLTEMNLIYATAYVVSSKTNNFKDKKPKPNEFKKPKWRERVEREIEHFREELSILEELSKGASVKTRKARKVICKYNLSSEPTRSPEI